MCSHVPSIAEPSPEPDPAERSAQLAAAREGCVNAASTLSAGRAVPLAEVRAAALMILGPIQAELRARGVGAVVAAKDRRELLAWYSPIVPALIEAGTGRFMAALEAEAAGGAPKRLCLCYGKRFRPYPDDLRRALWNRLDPEGEASPAELPTLHMELEGDGCGVIYRPPLGSRSMRIYCENCRRNATAVVQRRWARVRNAELGGGLEVSNDGLETVWLRVCHCGTVFRTTTTQQWACDRHSCSHHGRRPTFESVRISLSQR
jgi:hypothetical protein